MLAFRFRTKESPSNQKLLYIKLKRRFPFILKRRFPFIFTSTSHDTKSSTIASNRNFDCRFVVLLLSIFSVFSILPRGFPLPLATLPIIVSSFSTLHWTIEIKGKRVCNWLHWRQEVPFSHWFAVSVGVIICWRDARRTLWVLMSLTLAFDFGRIHSP